MLKQSQGGWGGGGGLHPKPVVMILFELLLLRQQEGNIELNIVLPAREVGSPVKARRQTPVPKTLAWGWTSPQKGTLAGCPRRPINPIIETFVLYLSYVWVNVDFVLCLG